MSETRTPYTARPLAVGDTVTWTDDWLMPTTRSGVVNCITHTGRYVTVTTEDDIGEALVAVTELHRIDAPASLEAFVNDYAEAILLNAGHLGVIEL